MDDDDHYTQAGLTSTATLESAAEAGTEMVVREGTEEVVVVREGTGEVVVVREGTEEVAVVDVGTEEVVKAGTEATNAVAVPVVAIASQTSTTTWISAHTISLRYH